MVYVTLLPAATGSTASEGGNRQIGRLVNLTCIQEGALLEFRSVVVRVSRLRSDVIPGGHAGRRRRDETYLAVRRSRHAHVADVGLAFAPASGAARRI